MTGCGPAPEALDWLVPDGCGVAVDLAAGNGPRELLGRASRVVAVEPDARMREVLARRSPELDVRAGLGEAMPLPDASADAVFVSTACGARYRSLLLVITKTVRWRVSGHRKPYHLHVETEYGAYGDQPWRDAEPPYPGQPARDGGPSRYEPPPPLQPQPPGRQRPRRTAGTVIAGGALVLGLIGLVISLIGVATELMPRTFTAGQQRQITDWEYGRSWRALSAGQIFPAAVSYQAPVVLDDSSLLLTARRIGIARQSTCRAVTDAAAAQVLDRNGCSGMLRATYTDGTDSYVVTIGVAVLPSVAQAEAADAELPGAPVGGIQPGVHALAFKNTPAALFTDSRRQISGSDRAGLYVALYTVGYADSRPREPVAGDSYADGEMTSVGTGVAQAVLAEVGASVSPPRCPGTPGC